MIAAFSTNAMIEALTALSVGGLFPAPTVPVPLRLSAERGQTLRKIHMSAGNRVDAPVGARWLCNFVGKGIGIGSSAGIAKRSKYPDKRRSLV